MNKPNSWKCEVCGYVHNGPEPPANCPICGVDRSNFTPFEIHKKVAAPASTVSVWQCSICGYQHTGTTPPSQCPVCDAKASLFEPQEDIESKELISDIEHIIIVGSGIAGLTAAQQARSTNSQVKISLISKETDLPYYRLNLTRFLAEEVSEEDLPINPKEWYQQNRIDLIFDEVVRVDTKNKSILFKSSTSLGYDRLILANGSHPFVPPINGAARGGVYLLRTLDDAKRISADSNGGSRCICIGGGLLGLETAGALKRRGSSPLVLEGFPWLLPRQLPKPAGERLIRYIEKSGIEVRCGVKISEIVGDEDARGVKLEDGEIIDADFVVLSTGVRPNSYLARQCQLKVDTGVVVDDRLFTSDASILAAGDVAEHRGNLYGIWPASYAQGAVAGINAAGGDAEFLGIAPSNRLKVMDVDLFSIGQISIADGSYRVFEDSTEESYTYVVCRDNRIVGAALYGNTQLASVFKDAIEERTQTSEVPQLSERLPGWIQFIGRNCQ